MGEAAQEERDAVEKAAGGQDHSSGGFARQRARMPVWVYGFGLAREEEVDLRRGDAELHQGHRGDGRVWGGQDEQQFDQLEQSAVLDVALLPGRQRFDPGQEQLHEVVDFLGLDGELVKRRRTKQLRDITCKSGRNMLTRVTHLGLDELAHIRWPFYSKRFLGRFYRKSVRNTVTRNRKALYNE